MKSKDILDVDDSVGRSIKIGRSSLDIAKHLKKQRKVNQVKIDRKNSPRSASLKSLSKEFKNLALEDQGCNSGSHIIDDFNNLNLQSNKTYNVQQNPEQYNFQYQKSSPKKDIEVGQCSLRTQNFNSNSNNYIGK
ncbi:hypothetical protein [Candidatus Deianiraea vastatrix]|uniref:Uncharacterized protein n=1 Tax=Candidatus Deianiraea vastatrix TaxID=2163644 RepID=A0A5B8XIX3_9RICK|nr:hypothetical protein [Candidatus Deianiraea vastatrix]QED23911.1 hypothetical protein Deia_01130 [Candidatus Deianiraea vastatrix]